ncbi:MAG TPA: hypothetical protein VJ161_13305, partial [Geobacteraceae bacterium]|nr:hypothetical protein [Geobacteraceae bacterium]
MKMECGWIKKWSDSALMIMGLFILLGTGIYWNSFSNPFQYDDQTYVELNENIRTLKNIPEFFVNPRMLAANPYEAGHYRPLVVSSYAVNYAIGGLSPFGYHIGNLAFHVGSAFLVFL